MRRSFKLASVCILFVVLVSLSASAGSSNNFSGAKLTGVSGGGTVGGGFSFNSITHQFSNISVSFVSSAFGTVNANMQGTMNGQWSNGKWWFQWSTIKNGDLIIYNVSFDPTKNQFSASGSIANFWNQGNYTYMGVPEGGAQLSYLMLCGFAVFSGILISKKRRPATSTAQSS